MSKAPLAGQAKTRLIPALGADCAARLQQHMLLDTIDLVRTALDGHGTINVVCPTASDRAALAGLVPDGIGIVAHEQRDLMSGLERGLAHHLAQGFEQVVLLDGDSPTLPTQYLCSAFDELSGESVVLGPTLDGGYYLFGACAPQPALFEWQRFDSATLCRQTQARAEALGARVALLPPWYDVDTAEDLERLVEELRSHPTRAPRTHRFLGARQPTVG